MTQSALIVIPNRATFVTAWALEESVRISPDFKVYLADLAKFESRYKGIVGQVYWFLDNVLEGNNIRNFLGSFCDQRQIEKIPFSTFSKVKSRSLDLDEELLFDRALRSTYSKHFGSGLIQKSHINQKIVKREKFMFQKAMSSIEQIVKDLDIQHLITINGRGFVDSCVVQTAKKLGLTYGLIELSGESWSFYSVHNTTTHSPFEVQEKIRKVWERDSHKFTPVELSDLARLYFDSRFSPENEWRNLQKNDSVEKKSNRYVVYFPTSDHEFASFPDIVEVESDFDTQMDSFSATAEICRKLNLELVVRVHPHEKNSILAKSEDEIWKAICQQFEVKCISSNSGVDSLKLAHDAYANITHLSTIGAELAWLDLPIAFTAHSTYSNLISDNACFTSESLENFLTNPSKSAFKDNLIRWAFYMSRGEHSVNIFRMNNFNEVWLGDSRLNYQRIFLFRFIRALAKLKIFRTHLFVKDVKREKLGEKK